MALPRRQDLQAALQIESKKFEKYYLWMEDHLPHNFFEDADSETILLVAHSLMDLDRQDYTSHIHYKNQAIALCLESKDSDLQILSRYQGRDLALYRTFISNVPPPFLGISTPLHIALIRFTEGAQAKPSQEPLQRLFDRAQVEDSCQIEIVRKTPTPQIALAWKILPEPGFVYQLARLIHRFGLTLQRMETTTSQSTLMMILALDKADNLEELIQELVILRYFPGQEMIEKTFVDTKLVSGNLGNLLKTVVHFLHQVLVHADPYLYSFENIEEGLCRHPEITLLLLQAFTEKFHPKKHNLNYYNQTKNHFLALLGKIDTGQGINDSRRKTILQQGLNFVEYTLKTNFYLPNKTGFSFRLDPLYLDATPFNRIEKFPELPYAIFFMKGLHFMGFHIRFRDLARGGLRTVYPEKWERFVAERDTTFSECYNLAYTQQKKNKDIPEGGAKGVILLEPCQDPASKLEYLYQAQRAYIESFLSLINYDLDGQLIDYYQKPEYIYLGPDENMHNPMIVWICNFAKSHNYKPGHAFMSSKPGAGINHKEFGVTSRGVNIYMQQVLKFLGIDPEKRTFTVKMTGGPDGDVAGNQMHNLYRFYPKTAKLLATIDVSGTIFDPQGLDLKTVDQLFQEGKPLRFYPSEKLSEGSFLLDVKSRKEESSYAEKTLLLRKQEGKVIQEWISGNEMNHLLRTHVHQVKADVFIPAGGRPRTLNEGNYHDFLDTAGKPTSQAIVEGGNLYLSPEARRALEKLGVIIIKDSSANKGGVICSSFEVLSSLVLSEEEFLQDKSTLAQEILTIIESRSKDEADLLLASHKEAFLTDVSDWISARINTYTDELFAHLLPLQLSNDPEDPLIRALLNYCPPLLRSRYPDRILKEVPDVHKKAIIACFLAQRLVYRKGLAWSPSIVDVLPLIIHDPTIAGP